MYSCPFWIFAIEVPNDETNLALTLVGIIGFDR